MSDSRFVPLGPLDSNPSSRAFIGYEQGPKGPLWPVVLIWVPEEVESDPDRMEQLQEDTARAAQIDHPNVIRVLGCEKLDEGYARVVEYPDAETLRTCLNIAAPRGGFPAPFLIRVVADAALGIHHVHEMGQAEGNVRGRLHGALRPETLLVGFDGITRVTGYGALAVAPRDAFGARVTPRLQYLSPEELEGGPAAADRRSDVYALAVVLYESLTGRVPYRFDDPDFEQLALAGSPPLEPLNKVDPLLGEVLLKGLARKPAERFATAGQFAQALSSLDPCVPAQIAQVMGDLFPSSDSERSTRAQLLREVGFPPGPLPRPISRVKPPAPKPAPKTTAPKPAAPKPAPAPAPKPAAPSPAASAPAAAAPPPAPMPAPPRSLTPPPKQGLSGGAVFAIVVAVIALLIGGLFAARPDLFHALVSGTPITPPAPPVAIAPPPPPKPVDVPAEPPPLPPPGPTAATLALSSDPQLTVTVDGKPKGQTPISVEVPPGDHRIRFRDPAKGIDIERSVHTKEGSHAAVSVKLGKASMELTAPAGAAVFLDGRPQGKAPTGTLHFYEGHHTLKVKMGTAVFNQPFDAEAGQALTLEVHSTPG